MSSKKHAARSLPYLLAAEALRNNPGQWAAYESTGNCVILAGPGSGKTKTITIKMARILAEDVRAPRGIACITYSSQCARELKKRLATLGVEDGDRAFIGTLHSFCLKNVVVPYAQLAGIPKRYPIKVATEEQTSRLKQRALDEILQRNTSWFPSYDRHRRVHLDRAGRGWNSDQETARVIERYEALLDVTGLIDFDGMVLLGLYLIQTFSWVRKALAARFPVLIVDEYQDLGYALDSIVRRLCFDAGIRLLAVGDPDQSIYGFTGSDPSLLRKLAQDPRIKDVGLEVNYRCGSDIIRSSEIALGEPRPFKSSHKAPGEVFFHEFSEGFEQQAEEICDSIIPKILARKDGRALGDIAILYQDKNEGDIIAKAVKHRGWKFIRVDGNNPYQSSPMTQWLEDCSAWCAGQWRTSEIRLSDLLRRWLSFNAQIYSDMERHAYRIRLVKFLYENRTDTTPLNDWLKIFHAQVLEKTLAENPNLADDKAKVERLIKLTEVGGSLSEFTVSFFGGLGGSPEHINLTTRHSSKGLEYDAVIMPGLEEGRIPRYRATPDEIMESRRIFYVGLTRARHEVHLTYSGWYEVRGRQYPNGRSTFVSEVEAEISSR